MGWNRTYRSTGTSAVLVMSAAAALVFGVPAGSSKSTAGPKSGGTLTIAVSADIPSLDPLSSPGDGLLGADRQIGIYSTLLKLDPTGSVVPNLATSMLPSKDKTIWTMTLRKGLQFTDGTPFNADAVIFNLKRELATPSFADIGLINQITNMLPTNSERSIRFFLNAASGSFPLAFTVTPGMIASPTAVAAEGSNYARSPVGAGPFMLTEWVQNDHMTMVRNPTYWDKPRPYVDSLIFRVIPDGGIRGQSLLTNAIQVSGTNATVLVTVAAQARQYGLLGVGSTNARPLTISQALDTASGGSTIISNMSHLPGSNIDFRHAIALAFDESTVSQVMLHGLWTTRATLGCAPFATDSPYCIPGGVWPKPNLAEAKSLIQKYLAAGGPQTVTYLATTSLPIDNAFVVQTLDSIGLNVNLNAVQGAARSVALTAGNFDIGFLSFTAAGSPYPAVFNTISSSAQNLPKQQNAALNNALETARDAFTVQARVAAYQQALKIMAQQYMLTFWLPQAVGWLFPLAVVDPGNQPPGPLLDWAQFSLK